MSQTSLCLTTESRAKIFVSIIEKVLLKYEYAKESIYSFNKHMLLQMRHCPFEMT